MAISPDVLLVCTTPSSVVAAGTRRGLVRMFAATFNGRPVLGGSAVHALRLPEDPAREHPGPPPLQVVEGSFGDVPG